jgi:hypothetical protein
MVQYRRMTMSVDNESPDGFYTNSDGQLLYVKAGITIIPSGSIAYIQRVKTETLGMGTEFHLIGGHRLTFTGSLGDELWKQANHEY